MHNHQAVVEQIVQNLAFEVEAIPKDKTIRSSSITESTPMNVKIKVRKKDESQVHDISPIVNGQVKRTPQKVRLVNSDQTIMTFDVLMEADFDKKTVDKPRKKILNALKPGICLGAVDDDDYAYLPTSTYSADITEPSVITKSDGILKQNFMLRKNTPDTYNVSTNTAGQKRFFGKCKPGGCLDPPFSEDKYAYKPSPSAVPANIVPLTNVDTKENLQNDEDIKNDIKNNGRHSSIFDGGLFKKKRRSSDKSTDTKPEVSKEKENDSVLNLYHVDSKATSLSAHSNPLITYPPKISSDLKIGEEKNIRSRGPSDDKSRKSFNDHSEPYFIPPKGVQRLKEKDPLRTRHRSSEVSELQSKPEDSLNFPTLIPIPIPINYDSNDHKPEDTSGKPPKTLIPVLPEESKENQHEDEMPKLMLRSGFGDDDDSIGSFNISAKTSSAELLPATKSLDDSNLVIDNEVKETNSLKLPLPVPIPINFNESHSPVDPDRISPKHENINSYDIKIDELEIQSIKSNTFTENISNLPNEENESRIASKSNSQFSGLNYNEGPIQNDPQRETDIDFNLEDSENPIYAMTEKEDYERISPISKSPNKSSSISVKDDGDHEIGSINEEQLAKRPSNEPIYDIKNAMRSGLDYESDTEILSEILSDKKNVSDSIVLQSPYYDANSMSTIKESTNFITAPVMIDKIEQTVPLMIAHLGSLHEINNETLLDVHIADVHHDDSIHESKLDSIFASDVDDSLTHPNKKLIGTKSDLSSDRRSVLREGDNISPGESVSKSLKAISESDPNGDLGNKFSNKNYGRSSSVISGIPSTSTLKSSLKKDTFSVDLGFHSYLNEKNERVVRTFDSFNEPKKLPNGIITLIKSQIRLSSNEIRIPVDFDHDLSIQIIKPNTNLHVSIGETELEKTLGKDSFQTRTAKQTNGGAIRPSGLKEYQNNVEKNAMNSNILDLYEKELVPLQMTITNLRNEIDVLAAQQVIFRDKIFGAKMTKIPRLVHSNKKCIGCLKK